MKVAMNTGVVFKKFGYKEGIRMLKRAGFECLDFSMFETIKNGYDLFACDDWKEKAEEILSIAKSEGVAFTQAHAPFPSNIDGDDEATERIFGTIVRAIEAAGVLGIKSIIVHPKTFSDRDNHWEENKEFYKRLIPYAEKAGVKIATENMWGRDAKRGYITTSTFSYAEDLKAFVREINSEWLVVCLDLGHVALTGREPEDEIRVLGEDLYAMHIHDTDYKSDLHTLPTQGEQNWEEICKALKDIGYKGEFTYEVGMFLNHLPLDLHELSLKYMYDVGCYLASKCE